MKITLTRTLAGHENGATIERSDKVAQLLIAHGAAIEAEPINPPKQTSKAAKDDTTATKGGRTRRSQRRTADADQANSDDATIDADKPAGQEGGGTPLPTPAPTAG